MTQTDPFAIETTEEERRAEKAREVTRLRYINKLNVYAKLLETLAVKLSVPDPYNSLEHLMESLRQPMEKVIRFLGE